MPVPIRVLQLEDEPTDAELVLSELRQGGFAPAAHCVDNERDYLAQLDQPYDVIISDYHLPQFDGLSALRLLRESGRDTPFILVSGAIGEEQAVAAIRQGADDYLMKDRLTRLGPAVARALEGKRRREERRRMSEALQKSEQEMRTLVRNIPDIVARYDRQLRYLFVSENIRDQTGLEAKEFIGKTDRDLGMPEHLIALWTESLRYVFETGQPREIEFEYPSPSGKRYFESRLVPEVGAGATVETVLVVTRNVTERKQAQEALRESEERYRILAEAAHNLIFIINREGIIEFANQHVAQFLGVRREEMIGRPVASVLPPDALSALQEYLGKILDNAQPVYSENKVSIRDRVVWLGTWMVPLADAHGKPRAILGASADITERKRAEEQERQSAARTRALVDVAARLNAQLDLKTVLTLVCEETARALKSTAASVSLYDQVHDHFALAACYGAPPGYADQLQPWPRTAVEEFLQGTGGVRVVLNIQALPDLPNAQAYRDFDRRSTATAIMQSDHHLVGVLTVHTFGETREYSPDDLEMLRGLAAQAALALSNARLFEKTARHAELMSILYDSGLNLNREHDPVEQMQVLVRQAIRALQAERAEFFRFDSATNAAHLQVALGFPPPAEAKLKEIGSVYWSGTGLVGWTCQNRVSVRLPDVNADSRYLHIDPEVRSGIWVPILREDELLGVMALLSTRLNAFSAEDERLLQLFANQAGIAMSNARLYEELRSRNQELASLYDLSTQLREAQSSQEMLQITSKEVRRLLGADGSAAILKAPHDGGLTFVSAEGALASSVARTFRINEGCSGVVVRTKQPYLTADYASDPHHLTTLQHLEEFGPAVFVPIQSEVDVQGVLFALKRRSPASPPFGASEVRLLTAIGEMLGNSLRRVRLYEDAERRLSYTEALHEIDRAISASMDLKLTFGIILEQVMTQLRVEAADVLLLNPVSHALTFSAGRGLPRALEQTRLHLGEGDAGTAVLERKTRFRDLAHAAAPDSRTRLLADAGFVAYCVVPLSIKGQVKGVLEVLSRRPLNADEEWQGFLRGLAGQMAIAIENIGLFNDLQRSNTDLALAYDATIEGWSRALDLRDRETEGHTMRVAEMTTRLARAMGIADEEMIHIRRGALLHDIGKMGVPDAILLKPGPLTEDEWKSMRLHPQFAYEMLIPIAYLQRALDIPYCHHEKWDGTGYPRGLKGEAIPLAARVFAVVDVWDALRSDRPYRAAWPEARVREHIQAAAGTHFDPRVVEAFLALDDTT